MEEKDLWIFLNTWEPKAGFEYDSEGKAHHEHIFAVAAKFAALVATRPERFDPKSKWWENITRVEVLNNILDSAADRFAKMQNDSKPVIADPTQEEWDIWFGINTWVMAHPWPRHSASRFLRNALKSNCTIPDRYAVALNESLRSLMEEVTEKDSRQTLRDFGQRLGIQIAFYYWNNAFSNDLKGEATLDAFFANAAPKTRAAVITQIGSIFEKSTNEKPSVELFRRAMRIWERRYEQIALNVDYSDNLTDEYDGELFGFTNWLDSECFSFDWRFEYGKKALNLLEKSREWYGLLKTIAKWAERAERLKSALDLFHAILTKPSENLRWSIQVKEFGPIISKGLSSDDLDIRKIAEQCRDELLKLGLFDFLEIGNPNTHA
jgi:hypothetical protein